MQRQNEKERQYFTCSTSKKTEERNEKKLEKNEKEIRETEREIKR
jgi:hypothetical protein